MVRRRLLCRACVDIEYLVHATTQQRRLHLQHCLPRAFSSEHADSNGVHDAVKAKDGALIYYLFLVGSSQRPYSVYAERLYGGLRSWDILVSESSQGRPDPTSSKAWHAWQLFTATLPALAIYLISTSQEKHIKDADTTDAQERMDTDIAPQTLLEDMNKRLTALESQIQAVISSRQTPVMGSQTPVSNSTEKPPCDSPGGD